MILGLSSGGPVKEKSSRARPRLAQDYTQVTPTQSLRRRAPLSPSLAYLIPGPCLKEQHVTQCSGCPEPDTLISHSLLSVLSRINPCPQLNLGIRTPIANAVGVGHEL